MLALSALKNDVTLFKYLLTTKYTIMFSYYHCAKTLFITEYLVFKQIALNRIISIFIWASCQLVVNGYFLPKLGITHTYGLISLSSCLAVAGLIDAFGNVMEIVMDLSTDKITFYYATLPMPTWMVFVVKMKALALMYMSYTVLLLPLGKLLLWNEFSLASVNWLYLGIVLILGNIFYAALTLFIASYVKHRKQLGNVWRTFIFPLWFLGGFGFTWNIIHEVSPQLAYLELMNPIIYVTESYRNALMGSTGLLNFWACVIMMLFFTCISAWVGIKRLTRQCDFI
jgi:ABC-type polysaccharide/polyol phosphate export permease